MEGKISVHVELEPGLSYSKTANMRFVNENTPEEIERLSVILATQLSKSIAAIYGDARKDSK